MKSGQQNQTLKGQTTERKDLHDQQRHPEIRRDLVPPRTRNQEEIPKNLKIPENRGPNVRLIETYAKDN